MFDPKQPYNELPLISTLEIDSSTGLGKLAEDTRVAVEILNYAVKTLPDPNILLDTLALQEARASSNIENIVTTMMICIGALSLKTSRRRQKKSAAIRMLCLPAILVCWIKA